MSCEIIQFSAMLSAKRTEEIQASARAIVANVHQMPIEPMFVRRERELPEPQTESCRNHRMRLGRRKAWTAARRLTDYWRARFEWHNQLSSAQDYDVADANSFPKSKDGEGRFALVALWRDALVKQMLTPAPDLGAIAWKRTQLKGGQHEHIGVKAETIERAIAADEKWLAAHPSKRSKPMSTEAMAHRRNFKEAMRQRIREIAASRDLSDEEIKPALRLKHQQIAEFAEKHGVNLKWLFEGMGSIFKTGPIRLCPTMTGNEFAAVVTTLPMADQRAIGTMLRDLVQQERDQ
jgi:hypothetical protein